MNKKEALGRAIEQLLGDETQAAVAKRAGLTETEVSLYKTGQRYPQEKNREKLARGLGCTLKQLDGLEWQYRTGTVDGLGEIELNGENVLLLDGLDKIEDPHLRAILEEASMASRHIAAFTDSMRTMTRRIVVYLAGQSSSKNGNGENPHPEGKSPKRK